MTVLALLSTLLLQSAPAGGEMQQKHASVVELQLSGRREASKFNDLDGDGRIDMVAVVSRPAPIAVWTPLFIYFLPQQLSERSQRRIEVFWNTPQGFQQDAKTTFLVPRSARYFSIADVTSAPGKEIIIFTKNGVQAVTPQKADREFHDSSEFVTLIKVASFFDYPSETALPNWNVILHAKTAAQDSIVVPVPDGFHILRPAGDGKTLVTVEELTLTSTKTAESSANRFFGVNKTLPRPFIADIDGDGNADFFMCDPSGAPQMIVYLGKANGRFAREPAVRSSPSLKREFRNDSITFETAEAVDLNRDGICDFIVSRTEGNIGLWDTLTTSQLIYYGRKGSAGYDPTPDQVVSSVGVSIIPRAIDFDGDGYYDLLVSSYRTDLLSNIKNAVLNSARVSYFLFLMDGGKYSQNPTVQRDIDLDFKVLERGGLMARAYFDGDFDGDGVKDLLAVEEEQRVAAYRGEIRKATFLQKAGYNFTNDPMMEIALRAPNDLEILDLDGDKRAEIIFPDARSIRIVTYKP